jgi:hypothetical protein
LIEASVNDIDLRDLIATRKKSKFKEKSSKSAYSASANQRSAQTHPICGYVSSKGIVGFLV